VFIISIAALLMKLWKNSGLELIEPWKTKGRRMYWSWDLKVFIEEEEGYWILFWTRPDIYYTGIRIKMDRFGGWLATYPCSGWLL
jgi:hypothetical protein